MVFTKTNTKTKTTNNEPLNNPTKHYKLTNFYSILQKKIHADIILN